MPRSSLTKVIFESGDWEIDLIRRELRSRGAPVPLGGRAFEIIECLVQSVGEVVSKDDLMSQVWPGSIVEEHAIQVHISAVRKALGNDRDMVQTVSGQGYRLLRQWTIRDNDKIPASRVSQPEPPSAKPARSNLPIALSELVGRSAAVEELQNLLSAYRAVTLTGPGGIGKTALAMEVARKALVAFPGDVLIVELAGLSDPSLVPSAASSVLGLRLGVSEISPEAVAQAIGERALLLVLDNCERVVDGAAKFIEALLRMCRNATVLATSREVLRIEGEYVYRVLPLGLPTADTADRQAILGQSAIQLFMNRTRDSDSNFSPSDKDLRTIATICRRLDGIPLAIVFAATHVATLGVEAVAARLDDRFNLLTGGRRTALPRHQTLRAILDWSYELLPPSEQLLLRHLAIFPSGFSLEAAAAVTPDRILDGEPVTAAMTSLFEKSLIANDGSGPVGRWRLLDTIRAYALQKLSEKGEAIGAARRHAKFFRDFVGTDTADEKLQFNIDEIARFSKEIDNVRTALDWSFSTQGDPITGVLLTAGYVRVWLHLGLLVECRERCDRAQQTMTPDTQFSPQVRMQIQTGLGLALFFTIGPMGRTKEVLNETLELAESLNDAGAQLRTLWVLWGLYLNTGDCRRGLAAAQKFSRVSQGLDSVNNPTAVASACRLMGNTMNFIGEQDAAREHLERALQLAPVGLSARTWGHVVYDLRLAAEIALSRVLWLQGQVNQAAELAQACVEKARATSHSSSICEALRLAVYPIAIETRDLAGAEQAVDSLTDLAVKAAAPFWRITADCLRGKLLIIRGEFAEGCSRLRSALQSCEASGWNVCYPEYLGALALGLSRLGRPSEAIGAIDQAIAKADQGGEYWFVPELYRLKGEIIALGPDEMAVTTAESLLREALELAQKQGALFWELRSATTLAVLMTRAGRSEGAERMLSAVYDRFPQGSVSPDCRQAATLLDAFRAKGSSRG